MKKPARALGCAAWALAACQPNSTPSTIDLLRAGDSGVCIANDVEETLRQLIKPKGANVAAYSISFADTSLETFDKAVARATCNTSLSITGPSGAVIERTPIDYTLTPASQNPSTFLVAADVQSFQEQLQSRVELDAAIRQEDAEKRRDSEALAALVKPSWLIGRWYDKDIGIASCKDGPFDEYLTGNRYADSTNKGTWSLSGVQLRTTTYIGSNVSIIIAASRNAFSIRDAEDELLSFERCTPTSMQVGDAAQPTEKLTEDIANAERLGSTGNEQ